MEVQTIRVAKTVSKKEATEIVKKLGYKTNIKPNPQYLNFHSFRQIQPNKFIKDSFKYNLPPSTLLYSGTYLRTKSTSL